MKLKEYLTIFFCLQNSSESKSMFEQSKDLLLKASQQIAFFYCFRYKVICKKNPQTTALKK